MPNQIMISGSSAMRGVAYSADTNGSRIALSRPYQPIRMPSGTPMTIAMPKPTMNS